MSLRRWLNVTIQILTLGTQGLIPALPLDQATKNILHVVAGFVSGSLAVIAHELDPTTGSKLPKP